MTASVYSEKTRLKKLMMMMKMIIISISIMNKSQETTVFHGRQIRYETKARKVMVDFKFIQVSLHREPPEVWLVKKVNRKFVLVGETARANPT